MQKGERVLQDDEQEVEDTMCLCLLTRSEVFVVWFVCCCRDPGDGLSSCVLLSRSPRLSLSLSLCGDWFSKEFWSGMGSDVFQTQRRGSWIVEKERAEKVLADDISMDSRKEWICKFCSASNFWTRWRCRRCFNNIPQGLRGTYRQAVAARTGEWSTGSSTSSGEEDKKAKSQEAEMKALHAQIEHRRNQNGGDAQGRQGLPSRRESGMEEEWRMDVEDEIESRKKLDEQRKKLQKDL